MTHHSIDVFNTEELCQRPSSWRGLRMNLNAAPFDCKVELLLQLFDDALADVAEGSDVIGKNFYADSHSKILISWFVGLHSFRSIMMQF
jgi:hypothetical protein